MEITQMPRLRGKPAFVISSLHAFFKSDIVNDKVLVFIARKVLESGLGQLDSLTKLYFVKDYAEEEEEEEEEEGTFSKNETMLISALLMIPPK